MDHYGTLQISKEASDIDIKKAYRKLAHQYHPDKASGDAEKFKEISNAYYVLSDAGRRASYDRFGEDTDFDFSSVAETMEQSARVASDRREQQLVKISSLIEQVVAQAISQKAQSITSELAKGLAERVLNLVYGDDNK